MSSSQTALHNSSYCTSRLFLQAVCNKIVKSTDILKYYLHEVTVLQWMGLFMPQTMVSFLISLHIQEIGYVRYTWVTLEVFHLKTQEVETFSLLVKTETIENNEEAIIHSNSLLCQITFLTLTWGTWKILQAGRSLTKKQTEHQMTQRLAIHFFWYRSICIDARSSANC